MSSRQINVRPINDRFSLDIAEAARRKSSADSRLKSTKIGGQQGRPLPLRILRYASVLGCKSEPDQQWLQAHIWLLSTWTSGSTAAQTPSINPRILPPESCTKQWTDGSLSVAAN